MYSRKILSSIFLAVSAYAAPAIDTAAYAASSIIHRDVAIIGGGSTGTYSAIRLHDSGKSVVVVEANDYLGGHTHTYTDPVTKTDIDYLVIAYHNISTVTDYFARFNIPLATLSFSAPGQVSFVDIRTGKVVTDYTPGDPTPGLAAYGAQLAQYPYLEAGFNLPDPVPADLLLPFGDFVKKYNLQNVVRFMFTFAQGLGDLLAKPTLYVFKNFGLGVLQGIQSGFLTTARHDNSELYTSAASVLGQDVLFSSHVLATDRNGKDAKILVQTPQGVKLIIAKKLIITIPPKLENLKGFDLSSPEHDLFAQFGNSAYYAGLLRNTGLPDTASITNIGADTLYNLPNLPGIYSFGPTGVPGLTNVYYGSATSLPEAQVKSDILASVARLGTAGTFNVSSNAEFATFASHVPFELTVATEAIKGGFYRDLYGLQGQRNTWYTGAAFHTHDSALLWQFTEGLLPGILAGL